MSRCFCRPSQQSCIIGVQLAHQAPHRRDPWRSTRRRLGRPPCYPAQVWRRTSTSPRLSRPPSVEWTADPCGPEVERAPPGTATYIEQLIVERHSYAPWFAKTLDYESTADFDVLDVGCGQGIDLARYVRAGARVTGVDLTPRHIELAQQHLRALSLEATVVEGDAERLPFRRRQFDRVSSNGVLHHTPDMPAALREIRRVLRPGGQARIIVYNRRSHPLLARPSPMAGGSPAPVAPRGVDGGGVLSANIERTSINARPLVRVTARGGCRQLLTEARFVRVSTAVGVFNKEDTPFTALLAQRTELLDDPRVVGLWAVRAAGM